MKKPTARQILTAAAIAAAAGVLLISRCSSGDTPGVATRPVTTSSVPASPSTPPTSPAGTPSADAQGDDGADEPTIQATPTSAPQVREAGAAFAAAWLNTYGKSADTWRAGLTPHVTGDLADDLADADPQSVPAGGRVGDPVAVTVEGSLYSVDAPVVTSDTQAQPLGTLHLTLLHTGGQWLVSEIDWEPRR